MIIGYGVKTDYKTGRDIDLDKTYRTIIEPVFSELGFLCFRASDIKHSGSIDLHMYENILKADFVIADLSTLNPNVLYELGIRHGVRKNTTLIIAEKELGYPFDLSHIVIDSYEHLGKAIDYEEVERFRGHLKEKVQALLKDPKVDSPLYTVIPALNHPQFTEEEVEQIEESIEQEESLSDLLNHAEEARSAGDFDKAAELLRDAIVVSNRDDFVVQRLASVVYKGKYPDEKSALLEAEQILEILKPSVTTDPETLGLSGAINKRLFEVTDNPDYARRALHYYERGYFIKQDYYNGINAAFMHTSMSLITEGKFEAMANFGQGMRIRGEVIQICNELIGSEGFGKREDQAWIYATLAEAHFGLDQFDEQKVYEKLFFQLASKFEQSSYEEQHRKLENLIGSCKARFNE